MKVTPLDRLTFLVTSESMPEVEWMVDLGEGSGECQCQDYVYRRKKKLNATCKHIVASKNYLVEEIIKRMKEQNG